MLSVAPAPGHAQQILSPGDKPEESNSQGLEAMHESPGACRNGAGLQTQGGISPFWEADAVSSIACLCTTTVSIAPINPASPRKGPSQSHGDAWGQQPQDSRMVQCPCQRWETVTCEATTGGICPIC